LTGTPVHCRPIHREDDRSWSGATLDDAKVRFAFNDSGNTEFLA